MHRISTHHRALSSIAAVVALIPSAPRAQTESRPTPLPRIDALAPLDPEQGDDGPRVPGWTFESIGYARDVGNKRIVRVGPEGDAELQTPKKGDGVELVGASLTARGDLVSDAFSLEPYRWIEVDVEYEIVSGSPMAFLGLRPTDDRRIVDVEFVPSKKGRTRSATVRVHSSNHQGPYSLSLSVGGEGRVRWTSVTAREAGEFARPKRPLCVIDIRSANAKLAPGENFPRVADLFGFPSIEYLHYSEFDSDKLEEIDPALIVLPGLWSSKGLDHTAMDAAVLGAAKSTAPIVGVCLGHQVLARAHGAKLRRGEREWGPTEVEIKKRDPLFAGLPRGKTFVNSESHRFEVTKPVGKMQIIASSAGCETQVFRYRGKPWYTFQGHIERGWDVASPEAVVLWKNMLRRWNIVKS